MDSDPRSVTTFRAASSAAQADLLAVLRRHSDALGGPLAEVHVLIELLGSVAVALLQEVPAAAPHVYAQLTDLALYVSASRSTPH
jgi:hypothetical protein